MNHPTLIFLEDYFKYGFENISSKTEEKEIQYKANLKLTIDKSIVKT